MKFYNKSNLIIFGGSGQIIKCWDRQHNKFLNNYTGHKNTINSMDINYSESNVSSVSVDGDILINSLENKASILKNITENPLNKIIYTKNSNSRVFTIDNHGFLYSYNTINLIIDNKIQVSKSSINDITILPQDNNVLVTANEDGTLTFFDSQSKNIVNTYKVNDPITAVSINPNNSLLACGTSRGQVLLYDIRTNKHLHKYWAETKPIQTLRFQNTNNNNTDNNNNTENNSNTINNSNNRKRNQSILTLENNKANPKKHMLSSEKDISEDLNNQADDSIFNYEVRQDASTPTPTSPLKTKISTPIKNNSNIISNLLSAFSSKKSQPQEPNLYSSNVNLPFDYNFSKNKPKYINNVSDDFDTLTNEKNIFSTTTTNKNNNSILNFSEFLKNNSYLKSNSKDTLQNTSIDTTPIPTLINTEKDTNQSSLINSKIKEISINQTDSTINANESSNKTENKEKGKEKDTNMEINSTATFNDIWLNPDVFSAPSENEEKNTSKPEESKSLSSPSISKSLTNEKSPTTKSGLSMPSQINSSNVDHPDESLYDHYLDENTDLLREKLQKNIKDELQKKGVSISNDDVKENEKLDEGIPTISNKILESAVDEGLQELKSFLRNDIKNMHLEIIGQFHFQKYEIEKLFKDQQEKIGPLLTELQKLREENERLKCQIYKM
ncbi:WD40 repeat-like protein [Neocallimastix lanati (nom. inval.)]|uniref:WD40 repeat-like protein n=1 Tax=Neocallimastix californiae TaxID=1754190 RepID=A0A1Y2AEA7_9FUNG|nr:WD40 repeat-like protein [Neocallimastix sp. JGI-2020a]ORY20899.1 WD40 repeat-like protein [Neocallimastix californiae]|eukprot:ORY20899.1 WD40 repeat-like protein [Neocallimastix californiae]